MDFFVYLMVNDIHRWNHNFGGSTT